MSNKVARIKVPRNRWLALCDAMKVVWPPERKEPYGTVTIGIDEDWENFLIGSKIIFIEGDHHLVEPLIHAIMQVIKSEEE